MYWKLVTFEDGKTKELSVFKEGDYIVIVCEFGESIIHPDSNDTVDQEIRMLYRHVVIIKTKYPWDKS